MLEMFWPSHLRAFRKDSKGVTVFLRPVLLSVTIYNQVGCKLDEFTARTPKTGQWAREYVRFRHQNTIILWVDLYFRCIYIYTPKTGTFADPTVQRFELFFPFECGVWFFWISRSIFFLWFKPIKCIRLKAFEGLTFAYPSEQATRYSFSAVSTSKSPGQRCSLAAASTWTRFFREEATKRPTLFIRLRLPLMAPKRLSALLSPPATKKQRLVSFTGYIRGLGMCEVCTEAVHCVALWTRVTLQVWACVKYVPKQSIA